MCMAYSEKSEARGAEHVRRNHGCKGLWPEQANNGLETEGQERHVFIG